MKQIDWKHSLIDSLLTAFIGFIVLAPITGLILEQYEIVNNLSFPLQFSIVLFLGRFLISIAYQKPETRDILKKYFGQRKHSIIVESGKSKKPLYLFLIVVFALFMILPFFVNKYIVGIMTLAFIYVLLGVGLNIVVGLAGLLDLGYVAFYAIGAYSLALIPIHFSPYLSDVLPSIFPFFADNNIDPIVTLSTEGKTYIRGLSGLWFWVILPVAPFLAAFAGMLLGFPVLRMHGDYLAIVTLGFGEIIRIVLNNWLPVTGGPNGAGAPSINFFGLDFTKKLPVETTFHQFFGVEYSPFQKVIFLYLVLFLVVCFCIYFVARLKKMPIGRSWEALRENEIACHSLGINHVNIKLSAFMLGASFGGIGGVFFAAQQGFLNPSSFNFFESALIVAIVVLGGLGSITGVVISALILTLMPEVLREFTYFRPLIFGLLMVLMMIWRPGGLLRTIRPRFIKS